MAYCDCYECKSEFSRLRDQLRMLDQEMQRVKRELEREMSDRRAAVRALANDISMVGH
jgi:molecular chaperone GrpE (heat shock protein)